MKRSSCASGSGYVPSCSIGFCVARTKNGSGRRYVCPAAVTAAGQTYRLPEPFFVLATQNPIEQEGTYPLPEAQLDRFMLQINVGYPTREEEERIVVATTGDLDVEIRPMLTAAQLSAMQHLVRRLPAPPTVVSYAVRLARSTRPDAPEATAAVKKYVSWGAGPRASQYLLLGAKARALLHGRFHATVDDIIAIAKPVLRHRMVLNFAAESEGLTTDLIIEKLLENVQAASKK